jgi:hypothetical protein
MRLLSLNIRIHLKPTIAKKPAHAMRELGRLRGLFYSFLLHEVAVFGIAFLSANPGAVERSDALVQIIDLRESTALLYLPSFTATDAEEVSAQGVGGKGLPRESAGKRGTEGLSYPGPQPILSDMPYPTNLFQTILQPGLVDPLVLPTPVMLPTLIQMADAGPRFDLPKPPPSVVPAALKRVEVPASA